MGVPEKKSSAATSRETRGTEIPDATKANNSPESLHSGNALSTIPLEHLGRELENSLRKPRRDHVDLFYIHRREAERPSKGTMDTLQHSTGRQDRGIGSSRRSAPAYLRLPIAMAPEARAKRISLWSPAAGYSNGRGRGELGVAFVAFAALGRGFRRNSRPDPPSFGRGPISAGPIRVLSNQFSGNNAAIEPSDLRPGHGHNADSLGDRLVLPCGGLVKSQFPAPGLRDLQDCDGDISATYAISLRRDRANPPGRVRSWSVTRSETRRWEWKALLTLGINRR